MNRDNRDRFYDVISSSSVGQGWILLVNVGQDFPDQQCWSAEKVKKGHLGQMEWDFGGLLVLLVTLDAKYVSKKNISHKNQKVLGDG